MYRLEVNASPLGDVGPRLSQVESGREASGRRQPQERASVGLKNWKIIELDYGEGEEVKGKLGPTG